VRRKPGNKKVLSVVVTLDVLLCAAIGWVWVTKVEIGFDPTWLVAGVVLLMVLEVVFLPGLKKGSVGKEETKEVKNE